MTTRQAIHQALRRCLPLAEALEYIGATDVAVLELKPGLLVL